MSNQDKFSAFFNRNKIAKETNDRLKSGAELSAPNTPNNWDEEGLFDLDRPPPVVKAPEPAISKKFEETEQEEIYEPPPVLEQEPDELDVFFENPPEVPSLRPGENHRKDLVYVAQAYVSSFKDGNPLNLRLLSGMCGKPVPELKKAFNTEQWLHFFKMFGVDPPQEEYKGHLTPRQLQVLQTVTNPLDSRKLNAILKELGVSSGEWRIWMRQPEFKELYTKWMRDGMKDVQGEVARQITAKATQGDPRSIETYLKLNGVNLQGQSSDVLVPFLLRELQKYMSQEQLGSFVTKLKELTSGSV